MGLARKVVGLAILIGGTEASADDGDLVAYGEYLSGQCVTCHQASGADKGIPSIVGWDVDAFLEVMNTYKRKERTNPVMQTIAASLSEEDIRALAVYFANVRTADN